MKEYYRGHEIINTNDGYRFRQTGQLVSENKDIACGHCGMENTSEGHDSCLGELPGVVNACCGHGKEKGYIQFENGVTIRGKIRRD